MGNPTLLTPYSQEGNIGPTANFCTMVCFQYFVLFSSKKKTSEFLESKVTLIIRFRFVLNIDSDLFINE